MKLYLNLTSIIILAHVLFLRKVTADSFDNWTKAMDEYLNDKIAKDPYKVYVDMKSDMDFFNDKFKRMKKDIDYQVVFTSDLLKQVGTELSNRTSNLSKEMNTFPEAIDLMNKDFSQLKDNIVELPRKQPCYSKMSPTIDSVKEMGLDLLNRSIEFNENSKIMTSNMVRISDQMGVIANGIQGKEMEDILKKFQEKVEAKTNKTTREYTANVHKTMVELEMKMNSLNVQDQRSQSIANGYKVEAQKQLELIRSKTLVDLQDELQFAVKSLQDVQFSAEDMSFAYGMLLQKAEFMVEDIDYTYNNGVWQSQVGGYKINKMAGLTVTNPDGKVSKIPFQIICTDKKRFFCI